MLSFIKSEYKFVSIRAGDSFNYYINQQKMPGVPKLRGSGAPVYVKDSSSNRVRVAGMLTASSEGPYGLLIIVKMDEIIREIDAVPN